MCALLLDVILGAIIAKNYFKNKENNKICNCETDMQMASECLDMIHDEKDENSNALTQIENNDCPSDCNIDIEKLELIKIYHSSFSSKPNLSSNLLRALSKVLGSDAHVNKNTIIGAPKHPKTNEGNANFKAIVSG